MNKLQKLFTDRKFDRTHTKENDTIEDEEYGEVTQETITFFFEGMYSEKEIRDFMEWAHDPIICYLFDEITKAYNISLLDPTVTYDKEVTKIKVPFYSWND